MYKDKRILALIPARGGSKGLPKKNIRPMLGKPLIAWTIEQARESRYVDKIVVSTDDEEIARISEKNGAGVPFVRPADLATDEAARIDVIMHALDYLESQGEVFEYLVFLEPTSPLREARDIDGCLEALLDHPLAKAIVSVSRLESGHPEFNVEIDAGTGCIRKLDGGTQFRVLRRQELKDVYFFDGTLYLSEVEALREKMEFYHELTLPYIVPKWKAVEIDEVCDFVCAEALLEARVKGLL